MFIILLCFRIRRMHILDVLSDLISTHTDIMMAEGLKVEETDMMLSKKILLTIYDEQSFVT